MDRFLLFLIDIVTHFMAGDTKSHGIGGFHSRIKTALEYNAHHHAYNQDIPECPIVNPGTKRAALVIAHKSYCLLLVTAFPGSMVRSVLVEVADFNFMLCG